MAKSITIKDIAREAGVSIALVSFVMNNRVGPDGKQKYRVSPATRERILEVARRMSYKPSNAARMLRQGRSRVIGVILPDMGTTFFGAIAKELENQAILHGYTLLFGNTEEDPDRFAHLLQSFMEKDVEGFILVPAPGSAASMEQFMTQNFPFVVVDRYYEGHNVPSVITDNAGAMHMALEELKRQGARKIEMVSAPLAISSLMDREKAFREEQGPRAHIYRLPFGRETAGAKEVADEILAKGTDGLVAVSNVQGVAIIKALFKKGVHIQRDVKLVCFDYSNVYSLFDPPIPYIQQPLQQMASEAAQYLFRLIEDRQHGEARQPVLERITLEASLLK